MKKISFAILLLCGCCMLAGCDSSENKSKITEQSITIEKLEAKVKSKEKNETKKSIEEKKLQEEKIELQNQVKEQNSKIDSLTKTMDSLQKEKAEKESPAEPLKITFSGEITIGEDLEEGAYDIRLPGEKSASFYLYKGEKEKEDHNGEFHVLSTGKDGKPSDELKTFKLKKGYILDIDGNIEFLKIR